MGVYVAELLGVNVGTRGMPLLDTTALYLQQQCSSTKQGQVIAVRVAGDAMQSPFEHHKKLQVQLW
jgi:hypothetical protein